MSTPRDAAGRRAIAAAFGAAFGSFCAGTTLVAIRSLSGEADSLTVTLLRVAVGTALLLPFAVLIGRGWPRGRDVLVLAAAGVLMFGVGQWLISASLLHTSAARGGILASATPFITFVMAVLVGAERFTLRKISGIACAMAGAALALWQDASAVPGGWRGDLLMLAGATTVSIFNVATRRIVRRFDPFVFIIATMLPGTLFLAAVAFASGLPVVRFDYSAEGWLAILYIGVAGSAVTYGVTLWALRHTTPTRVSVAITMNPVDALLGASVILGEPLTAGMLIGLAAIVVGIALTNWQRRGVPA